MLGQKGACLIVDKFIHDTYKDIIITSFEAEGVSYELAVFGGECSKTEIEAHQKKLGSFDVVVGISGGKTLDTAKAVAFYAKLPVMIVPTAASSDAYLPLTANPDMVIMDTDIIAKAPARFLAAGIGDALATYYEAVACKQSNAVTMAGGHVMKVADRLGSKQ